MKEKLSQTENKYHWRLTQTLCIIYLRVDKIIDFLYSIHTQRPNQSCIHVYGWHILNVEKLLSKDMCKYMSQTCDNSNQIKSFLNGIKVNCVEFRIRRAGLYAVSFSYYLFVPWIVIEIRWKKSRSRRFTFQLSGGHMKPICLRTFCAVWKFTENREEERLDGKRERECMQSE